MKKEFPFRPSTLQERKQFYEKEFSLEKVKNWFKKNNRTLPQICALDAGTETNFIKNKKWKGIHFYFPFKELKEKIKKYVPEDIYYDRNLYKDPEKRLKNLSSRNFFSNKNFTSQELVFDIDSDNFACFHSKDEQVCNKCLNQAWQYTLKLKKTLSNNFQKIKIVYSGRGFHLHVLDRKAFFLSIKEREKLVKKFSKFPIDPWVSRGYIELVRLPYTLNSLVSRKVMPLSNKEIFREKATIPQFLKKLRTKLSFFSLSNTSSSLLSFFLL